MPETPRALVLRVNELFHDAEGAAYADVHPEIFDREAQRWKNKFKEVFPNLPSHRTILDIGCGTGFLGMLVNPHLTLNDTLICADISQTMLDVCRQNLQKAGIKAQLRFVKMKGEQIALSDATIDLITLNSVLHHVPDTKALLETIDRLLKPGGLLIIGHEPNALFFRGKGLFRQTQFLHYLAPRRLAAAILRTLGLYGKVISSTKPDPITNAVNKQLFAEGLIQTPLTSHDISQLVDVHSPTAGGLRTDEGFNPFTLLNPYSNLKLVHTETYNHLLKLSGKYKALGWYEKLLANIYPKRGAAFFLVGKKK